MSRGIEKKKETAKSLYTKGSMLQKEIAGIVAVSEQTISSWIKKENWDVLKTTNKISIESLEQMMFEKINKLLEDENGVNADKVIKLTNSLDRIRSKEPSAVTVIGIMKKYTEWLIQKDFEFAKTNTAYQDEFVREFYF